MTITVDISPEVRAALARKAAAQGREVESYAASLLEQAGPFSLHRHEPVEISILRTAEERQRRVPLRYPLIAPP